MFNYTVKVVNNASNIACNERTTQTFMITLLENLNANALLMHVCKAFKIDITKHTEMIFSCEEV